MISAPIAYMARGEYDEIAAKLIVFTLLFITVYLVGGMILEYYGINVPFIFYENEQFIIRI